MFRFLTIVTFGFMTVYVNLAGAEWVVEERFNGLSLLADYEVDSHGVRTQLTQLAAELEETLGVKSAGDPVQILLFKSRRKYLAYVGSAIPSSRERRAVFVRKGRLTTIYCYRSDKTLTDLRHEMTHALLHQYLQFLPLWMDEGLAEYFEETPEQRVSSARTRSLRWKSAVGWTPDLDQLEQVAGSDHLNPTHYADSWAICCYLLNESHDSRRMLREYLQRIHNGHAPAQFSEVLKDHGNDWQTRTRIYFRKPTFRLAAEFSDLRQANDFP